MLEMGMVEETNKGLGRIWQPTCDENFVTPKCNLIQLCELMLVLILFSCFQFS
jgi:hypothetical protein